MVAEVGLVEDPAVDLKDDQVADRVVDLVADRVANLVADLHGRDQITARMEKEFQRVTNKVGDQVGDPVDK